MAGTAKGHMHSIDLDKFLRGPEEALDAALKKRQTAVVGNDGQTRLVIGTNCETYFELPEFEEPSEEGSAVVPDRERWLK